MQSYDYTEGASAVDIQNVLENTRRARRDSSYGDEGEGAVFDGPGHSVIPSSVSRMSIAEQGRKSSDMWRSSSRRRRSEDSVSRGSRRGSISRRTSTDTQDHQEGDEEYLSEGEDEEGREISRRSRRRSPSPPPASRSVTVFENIAQMFGRAPQTAESPTHSRRPSLMSRSSRSGLLRRQGSRRSDAGSDYALESEEGGDDRWGYASSEEDYESETSETQGADIDSIDLRSLDERSYPPSPGPTLPLMAGDPIFGGEERIDMGELEPLAPPPPGPPSRQTIYIEDEDISVRFVGYETIPIRQALWRMCCVISLGLLGLLGHWFPRIWLRWVAREKAFKDTKDGFVVVEVRIAILPFAKSVHDRAKVCL